MRPVMNSEDVYGREEPRWIIDNADETLNAAALYEAPHRIVVARVKPKRDKNRDKWLRENWWRPQRMRAEMRQSIAPLNRFIVTATTSKHRIFLWLFPPTLPDHKLVVFARDDDYFFGVFHSRYHQAWAQGIGTQLRERESGLNYNVQSSFETFPFPESTTKQKFEISIAAKELNELRENWLNPSEWTMTKMLEFPGATDGPWSRFIVDPDARAIGTVRYPRAEARDDDCAKKLAKRTLTNLYNERPAWLANAHAKLDAAVAQAYGFPVDLTDEQILERLLALNQQRATDEKPATKKQLRVSRARTEEEFV
jgi:MmeI, target recognition domain